MGNKRSYDYSPVHRALEIGAIIAMFILAGVLAWRSWGGIADQTGWIVVASAIFAGYVGADFVSGIVHWLADTYGTEKTFIAGPNLVRPFREHHRWPEDITKHDFIETNGNNCLITVPVMALVALIPIAPGQHVVLFGVTAFLSLSLSVFATNQFHKWAHTATPPSIVRAMQACRLILPRDHHQIHHTPPFDRYYCITTGWLNWPLRILRFYEISEWTLRLVLRWEPRAYTLPTDDERVSPSPSPETREQQPSPA